MGNVFQRATAAELAELHAASLAWSAATADLEKMQAAKAKIEGDLRASASYEGQDARAAFESYMDGQPEEEVRPGPAKATLEKRLAGAVERIRDESEKVERARGHLRAVVIRVERSCCDREAAVFVAAATALHASWIALAGAQASLASVVGHEADVIDDGKSDSGWRKLFIPGSKLLPTLAAAGFDAGDSYHTRIMADGANRYDTTASAAALELEQAITAACGVWPFGKRTSFAPAVVASPARAEQEEASRQSRRAALERGAEGIAP